MAIPEQSRRVAIRRVHRVALAGHTTGGIYDMVLRILLLSTLVSIQATYIRPEPVIAQQSFSGQSPTCGPISGRTSQDLQNVRAFCRAVPEQAAVGAYAMETILVVKVSRAMAIQMRADRLASEQLMSTWMRGWKNLTGSSVVTVRVEWGDVLIAEGQTTCSGLLCTSSRDRVTIP